MPWPRRCLSVPTLPAMFTLLVITLASLLGPQPLRASCVDYNDYMHTLGYAATPGAIQGLDLRGNFAFLAASDFGLQIMDISDPLEPALIGSVDTPGDAEEVVVSGQYAFVADYVSGLQIIDIANPLSPALVASLHIPSAAEGLDVDSNYVYVASPDSGLQIVDVTDPLLPHIVGTVAFTGETRRVQVKGNLAYVAASNALQIVDVSNPADPLIVGTLPLEAYSIRVTGTLALVGGSAQFNIVDVSNPASPVLLGATQPMGGVVFDMEVTGDLVFASFYQAGIRVFDISNPASPAYVTSFRSMGTLWALELDGDRAYLGLGEDNAFQGLQVVDISKPVPLSPVSETTFVSGGYPVFAVDNGFAFVASNQFQVFDMSPTPHLVGSIPISQASDVFVNGNRAYIASGFSGLQVVDISNPTVPALLGSADTPGFATGLVVEGNTAYVADGDSGVAIIDVTNATSPTLISHIATPYWSRSLGVNNTYLYVVNESPDLLTIDVSDPEIPVVVDTLAVPGPFGVLMNHIMVAGDRAYVGSAPGLLILDLSDPSSPAILSQVYLSTNAFRHVSVNGNLVWIDDGSGFHVVDVSNPALPRLIGGATSVGSFDIASALDSTILLTFDPSTGITGLATYPTQCPLSVPVRLVSLQAESSASGTLLTWSLTDEANLAGFHVHRRVESGGDYIRLTSAILPSLGPHEFLDRDAPAPATYLYRLEALDRQGRSTFFGPVTAHPKSTLPRTVLDLSRPNPFGNEQSTTTMRFTLAETSPARIKIFDASGRVVRVLWDGFIDAGSHSLVWDGRDDRGQPTAAGLYYYRLETKNFNDCRPIVKLR